MQTETYVPEFSTVLLLQQRPAYPKSSMLSSFNWDPHRELLTALQLKTETYIPELFTVLQFHTEDPPFLKPQVS
jgi:hypothetical protein